MNLVTNGVTYLGMSAKYRILILDDEEEICSSLAEAFKDKYEILISNSAETALSDIEKLDPALVFTDINMPQISGLQFLKILRDRGDERHVVVMTGQGGIQNLVQALKLRVFDFIEKPFKLATLEQIILSSQKITETRQKQQVKIADLNLSDVELAKLEALAKSDNQIISQFITSLVRKILS